MRTHIEIKLYVRIFFALGAIVMRSAFGSASGCVSQRTMRLGIEFKPYTCTLRRVKLEMGACGVMKIESATRAATQEATVVKNPKTFCTRTKAECIFGELCGVWVVGGRKFLLLVV